MRIDILTLFPDMFKCVLDESMMKIAKRKGIADIRAHNIREWTFDRHRTADDKPFGGGPGMVMKVEPVYLGIQALKKTASKKIKPYVILMTPQGRKFGQKHAKRLAEKKHLILVCGHYEGFDERIRFFADEEISMGDYVLTCGEIPAMALCDAVVRLLPGVLGAASGLNEETFENGLLEYPQYTRPADYMGMKVPDILLCGDPKKINAWRKSEALKRTRERRPDLLKKRKI